jgi:Uma2 family endonuclease
MIHAMPAETITKKLFTVDEFYRIWESGVFPENGRYELVRGEIIEMRLPQSPHSSRVKRLIRVFTSKLGESVIVSVQDSVILDEYSEVLPDVALLKPRDDFYEAAQPSPQDVLVMVEVSHKSSRYDTKVKGPLYAEAGIPEYWQLDVLKECLIVRTEPTAGEYRSIRTFGRGETVSPIHLPNLVVSVDELLGSLHEKETHKGHTQSE